MKKVIFTMAVSTAFLSSCKKEEICNCGEVVSDNASNYSVSIKNDCSGNTQTFTLSQSDWYNAYVGSNYCITNVDKW